METVMMSYIFLIMMSSFLPLPHDEFSTTTSLLKVIGVCGTEDKADLVRQKGAWSALKYNKKHVQAKVCAVLMTFFFYCIEYYLFILMLRFVYVYL